MTSMSTRLAKTVSTATQLDRYGMNLRLYERKSKHRRVVHSTCSGDSEIGVMGLEARRCLSPLRLRSLLDFFGA
jgi:hypothetical protein